MPRLNRLASARFTLRVIAIAWRRAADARRLVKRLAESKKSIDERDDTIANLRMDVQVLTGENEILKAQLAMFEDWRLREQARLEAEAAIEASRRAAALGLTQPQQAR